MRRIRIGLSLLISPLLFGSGALAQNPTPACTVTSGKGTLYCAPILSTENAYTNPYQPTFPVQQTGFVPINSSIGTELSRLPSPAPASGLIFSFGGGGLTAERALGPIFSNSPWAVGRHKLYLAFAYQYFDFDSINSVSLSHIPLLLSVQACKNHPTSCTGQIETNTNYGIVLNEYISYATFGITNRLDVSATIPIVDTRTSITTVCTVCLQSVSNNQYVLGFTSNAGRGSSSGIGDAVFGIKGTALRSEHTGLALGVDVRAPSGDAYNFRGAGTVGAHPYIAFGYTSRISAHATVGGWINGDSILASANGVTKAQLPDSIEYSAGADFSATHWLSLSGDFLGQAFVDASTVAVAPSGLALHASTQTYNTNTVAVGLKILAVKNLLVSANGLIDVDHNALHYKPSPMVGISYVF
jgi:hypothetical protein